jgi:hypothetical protein
MALAIVTVGTAAIISCQYVYLLVSSHGGTER